MEKNKPITIFLDIDGVLCTDMEYSFSYIKQPYNCPYFNEISQDVLSDICKLYNPILVLSSDWKHRFSIEHINEIFCLNGFKYTILDYTPDHYKLNVNTCMSQYYEKIRAGEILDYVQEHDIKHWIAIDDLCIGHLLSDLNFVRCKTDVGLKERGLKEKIIQKIDKILSI